MNNRASIIAAAVSHVGNVREHNEDAHFVDASSGVFVVCDGMGGHAAGEVASSLAVKVVREHWTGKGVERAAQAWADTGTAEARRALLTALRDGAFAAHHAIVDEARVHEDRRGMGTTFVGTMIVGNDAAFAHAGDSRAYLVRDGIAVQLTEDHTLLARLQAAGIDVDVNGDGARFKTMLTNALGIGEAPKASTFIVPLIDGDRMLLCSDGVSEYVSEQEVGELLTTSASPALAAQSLVDLALERGGHDNATAVVLRVLEVGSASRPADRLRRDQETLAICPLFVRMSSQQILRALRIAVERDLPASEKVPAHTLGDRVAWILLEGEVERDGELRGPGSLLYLESLVAMRPPVDREQLYSARTDLRALAIRCDDFQEFCAEDSESAELLLEGMAAVLGQQARRATATGEAVSGDGATNPDGIPTETSD
jgi:serine/threonine protein phosphatase PrpC